MACYMVDFHGVIDVNPDFFRSFMENLVQTGNKVIICSGARMSELNEKLPDFGLIEGVHYNEKISVTDYLESILPETEIEYDLNNNIWVDEVIWWSTKGKFCRKYHVDVIIDDSEFYLVYVKPPTLKMLFKPAGK